MQQNIAVQSFLIALVVFVVLAVMMVTFKENSSLIPLLQDDANSAFPITDLEE